MVSHAFTFDRGNIKVSDLKRRINILLNNLNNMSDDNIIIIDTDRHDFPGFNKDDISFILKSDLEAQSNNKPYNYID